MADTMTTNERIRRQEIAYYYASGREDAAWDSSNYNLAIETGHKATRFAEYFTYATAYETWQVHRAWKAFNNPSRVSLEKRKVTANVG
jgi:hypothetical protein